MPPPFYLRGYTVDDPLDNARPNIRYVLTVSCTAVISILFLYLVFDILQIAALKYAWLFWVECAAMALLYAPLVTSLRKSSSLAHIGLLVAALGPLDLFMEVRYRAQGSAALWTYNPDALLGPLHPLARILVVWCVDALVCGPVALWFARLLAAALFKKKPENNRPTAGQRDALFPDCWTLEPVEKPVHDTAYYILRVVGLAYFFYLVLLILGLPGEARWPPQLGDIFKMTYANPALAINTFTKLTLMIVLALLGADNVKLRWHCSLALLVGHMVSTLASLFFYFYAPGPHWRFLLASAIVDAVMSALFVWVMIRFAQDSHAYERPKEFPEFYSLPQRLTTIFYYTFGTILGLIVPGVLFLRLCRDGASGWGAVFGYPDPQVCNTLTKYATLSFLAFLMARREALREVLYKTIVWPYSVSVIASALWLLAGMFFTVSVATRTGSSADVDWCYMVNVAIDGAVVMLFLGLRKMFYDVDYSISAMSASSAQNVAALDDALYGGDPEDHSATAQGIDRHIGDIRGRKRGLINFPFWIVEHILPMLYGLHIGFSSLDRYHQRSFLRRYVLRPPRERAASFVPELAEAVYKIGTAVHALTTLARFSRNKHRAAIGYVPADARDRLQGDYPSAPPPFLRPAPLPLGPDDPSNDKPSIPSPKPLIAPRVSTPDGERAIPDKVDYLIVGSGAGGAAMAYRLSCHTDKILVVERGQRYSPLQDFNDNELEMIRKLYKEGGLQHTRRFDLTILQGECVGGSTVVNNAICFRMPKFVQDRWMNDYGIDLTNLQQVRRHRQ